MQVALWRCCSVCPSAFAWCFSAYMRVVLLSLRSCAAVRGEPARVVQCFSACACLQCFSACTLCSFSASHAAPQRGPLKKEQASSHLDVHLNLKGNAFRYASTHRC